MQSKDFSKFLVNISLEQLFVLNKTIPETKYTPIDLSESNALLNSIDISSSKKLSTYINKHIKKSNSQVAFGGYLEVRNLYKRSKYFNKQVNEKRNIHLGIDLWCDANTPIFTPLDATVHSFKNNTNYGDYGPTIILKHIISSVEFYTLYGHLSLASMQNLEIGMPFKKNDKIATLGNAKINGDYPPHLHFQIIKDIMDYQGDYPGVCNKKDIEFYKENCPNPNLLLKLG